MRPLQKTGCTLLDSYRPGNFLKRMQGDNTGIPQKTGTVFGGLTGFTLVEILIVVVILGILSALVVPRFTAAPERARVAEASNMLGAIRRAQITRMDSQGLAAILAIPNNTDAAWATLGMQAPGNAADAGPVFFTYTCDAVAGTCLATRSGQATRTITVTVATGAIVCGAGYTLSNGVCI